ncbi:hypothetical protein GCM10009092_35870 [Bowmanella denitrificans]|uniref:Uncharacterized protein n=1 Tax=Bowmanella denitrificans TaxID=366582 RepID=A0ABP3HF27_9ALTE
MGDRLIEDWRIAVGFGQSVAAAYKTAAISADWPGRVFAIAGIQQAQLLQNNTICTGGFFCSLLWFFVIGTRFHGKLTSNGHLREVNTNPNRYIAEYAIYTKGMRYGYGNTLPLW